MSFHDIRVLAIMTSMIFTLWQVARIPSPRPRLFILLGWLTLFAFALEVVGAYTTREGVNNSVLYNSYAVVELLFVLIMMRECQPRWSLIIGIGGGCGLGALIWAHSMYDGRSFMLIEGIVGSAMVITGLILAHLFRLARITERPLQRMPEFWLWLGFLVYFGGLPPVVGVIRYVFERDAILSNQLWSIPSFLCVLRYILTAYASNLQARLTHGQQ